MKSEQRKLLHYVLASVPHTGWTEAGLAQGAMAAGFSTSGARKIFPHGICDVVTAFHLSLDEAMQARIEDEEGFPALRVREKIAFAVRARLEAVDKNREAMRRLIVWSMLPQHIRHSSKHVWGAADAIWRAAGDTSTDYNYYTKRLLLIVVMKATLSFWLQDTSPDYRDTWEFLDRRIASVLTLGKGLNVMKAVGVSGFWTALCSRFGANNHLQGIGKICVHRENDPAGHRLDRSENR